MVHTDEAVARVALLAAKAATICDEFESAFGPVMRAPASAIPPPAPNMTEDAPAQPMPPLFANLHEQMDVLENQLGRIVQLMGRVEL